MINYILLFITVVVGSVEDPVQRYIDALTMQHGRLENPASLIQLHVDSESQNTVVSKKKPRKVRDLDCDAVVDYSDAIEDACHSWRYSVLVQTKTKLEGNARNMTTAAMNLQAINGSLNGDPLTGYGLGQLIDLQHAVLYGGSNILESGQEVKYRGLIRNVLAYGLAARNLYDQSVGVMDTAWTNFASVMDQLAEFMGDQQTKKYMLAIADGMADSEIRQKSLLISINQMKTDMVDSGNVLLEDIADRANAAQKPFLVQYTKLVSKKDDVKKSFTEGQQKASDKLEQVTSFLNDHAVAKMADYIDKMTATGQTDIKKARDDFFNFAHDEAKAFKTDVDKMAQIFSTDSDSFISKEQADWVSAATQQQVDLNSKQRDLKRKSEDESASIKLEDATEMASMNDMAVNLTDWLDTNIYASQDAVLKVSDQLKKLRSSAETVGKDVGNEFNNLLQELTDGTTSQRDKISSFMKLAADSSASELAALVQSAAKMRDGLGTSQSGAYADISSLIANLQVKLAQKAQDQGGVSADVQKALSLGQDTSQAKIGSTGQYQAGMVGQASSGVLSDAEDVLNWLRDSSVTQSGNSSMINRDLQSATAAGASAITDQADLQRQNALGLIQKLRALSSAGGKGASQSLNDASDAAQSLLASLSSVRDGTTSLSSLMADRSGALQDKLSSIAKQLGVSDDSASQMFSNLFRTAASDADTKISQLLESKAGNVRNQATTDGGQVSQAQNQVDSLTEETESAQKRAAESDAKFQSQLDQVSQTLDSQFSDRLARDAAIKTAITTGLGTTRDTLAAQAKKALDSVSATRQALADDATVQLDKDLGSLASKVSIASKQQFDQMTDSFGQIQGPGRTDVIRASTQLDQSISDFSKFFSSMVKTAGTADSAVDIMEREFKSNSTLIATSLSNSTVSRIGTDLNQSASQLVGFLKTVPRRISEQIKIIEDSFVSTDQQLAMKAKILESMANKTMTDEERAALSHEMDNLKKSQSLMSDFQVVQRQALNEVFTRQSGLLGKTGGTLGDLQGIANSVSNMLNNNAAINDRVDQAMAKSRVDFDSATSAMNQAVTTTNSSLGRQLDASNSQAGFSTNISNAQMGALIESANRDGSLAAQTASDVTDSSDAAISEKRTKLDAMVAMLQANRNTLLEATQRTLNAANSTSDQFKMDIESNGADRDQQLFIVKNAVQRLLQLWAQYTDTQNRKFNRWNKTEDEYYGQVMGNLRSLNQSAMDEATKTQAILQGDELASSKAILQLVQLENELGAILEQTRDAGQALNVSTERSADQLGEEIYRVDSTDKSLDDQARDSASGQASDMEAQADKQASGILESIHVQLPGTSATKGSLLQEEDVEALNDDTLRNEIDALDSAFNRMGKSD